MSVALRMIEYQLKQLKLQETREPSQYDPLTEIPNRRSILASLKDRGSLCQQRQQPLGI